MPKLPQTSADLTLRARVEGNIVILRGAKVLLDEDLAAMYGVPTRQLVQAVKRNLARFPDDFMFQLSAEEFRDLRSQSVISKGPGGRRYPPYAFTEQGVAMLSSVLHSDQAIQVNIEIMRAFVRLRQILNTHQRLAAQLAALEKKYDAKFKAVFEAIRQLMDPIRSSKRKIGFSNE